MSLTFCLEHHDSHDGGVNNMFGMPPAHHHAGATGYVLVRSDGGVHQDTTSSSMALQDNCSLRRRPTIRWTVVACTRHTMSGSTVLQDTYWLRRRPRASGTPYPVLQFDGASSIDGETPHMQSTIVTWRASSFTSCVTLPVILIHHPSVEL